MAVVRGINGVEHEDDCDAPAGQNSQSEAKGAPEAATPKIAPTNGHQPGEGTTRYGIAAALLKWVTRAGAARTTGDA